MNKRAINSKYSVSVVIPCYNEEGNIENCIKRVPKLGSKTEIIVVDDGSKDLTASIVKKLQKKYPNLKLISYSPNRGKGFAVSKGLDASENDILIILDADMTVIPEEMPNVIKPFEEGKAEFTSGTRFFYKMEEGAMKRLNNIGNQLVSFMFSLALGQKITDSLCGTKALFRKDYKQIGIDQNDPWGDFSLIFGAAKQGLKILEVPVHYKRRVAGQSKMNVLKHGVKLLQVWFNLYQSYRSS